MVGASPGRGDNGTETSLNNSCYSRRGANRLHEGFHQEGEERKALSRHLGVLLSVTGSASPACCGFNQCRSPHLGGPGQQVGPSKVRGITAVTRQRRQTPHS